MLKYNNKEVALVKWGGQPLDKLMYNGVVVGENIIIYDLGEGTEFNITKYNKYKDLTADNFMISTSTRFAESGGTAKQVYGDGYGSGGCKLNKTYNATEGKLSCNIEYGYTYRDSNGNSPRYYDKFQPVHAYLFIKLPELVGTGTSFNIKELFPNEYAKFTEQDFYISACSGFSEGFTAGGIYSDRSTGRTDFNLTKSYNASSGILTCYVKYLGDYRDSNGSTPKSFDKQLPVTVYLSNKNTKPL